MLPSKRGPVAAVGFPLACIRRFRLRARVGVTVAAPSPLLTDPTVQISRSGFVERTHHLALGVEADSRASYGDIGSEF
jgi:hypothetical protein